MKKSIIVLAMCMGMSGAALAQHHAHYYRSMDNTGVIVSGILLGAVISEMSHRNSAPPPSQPVVVQNPQVVVVERQPVPTMQTCTEWREIIDSYGRVYRERTCTKY